MSKILDDRLATAGLWSYTYQILNDNYGENDYDYYTLKTNNSKNNESTWQVLDVRDLFDDDSNSLEDYMVKIDLAWDIIQKHGKVVICCVAGMSRSNAITIGVLVKYFNMDFFEALALVKRKVSIANIHPAHLIKLKKLFGMPVMNNNSRRMYYYVY